MDRKKDILSGPQYETLPMWDHDLPIKITLRHHNACNRGCELHWHEALEFYYVQKGCVSLMCNGQMQELMPGDVGFVNWCQPHRSEAFLDGTEHYIIQVSTDLFEQEMILFPDGKSITRQNLLLMLASPSAGIPGAFRNCSDLNKLLDILIRETNTQKIGYTLACRGIIFQLLIFLIRQRRPFQNINTASSDLTTLEHLKNILVYLSIHYAEPELVTLSALSHHFGLSVSYLCRIFKQHTSLTLSAYINELRCLRAAALIQEGQSLTDAAFATGFRDYNYFSRLFKKVTGVRPSFCRCNHT